MSIDFETTPADFNTVDREAGGGGAPRAAYLHPVALLFNALFKIIALAVYLPLSLIFGSEVRADEPIIPGKEADFSFSFSFPHPTPSLPPPISVSSHLFVRRATCSLLCLLSPSSSARLIFGS